MCAHYHPRSEFNARLKLGFLFGFLPIKTYVCLYRYGQKKEYQNTNKIMNASKFDKKRWVLGRYMSYMYLHISNKILKYYTLHVLISGGGGGNQVFKVLNLRMTNKEISSGQKKG